MEAGKAKDGLSNVAVLQRRIQSPEEILRSDCSEFGGEEGLRLSEARAARRARGEAREKLSLVPAHLESTGLAELLQLTDF